MRRFENVLVLAPHTDDGELGAGCFINKLVNDGSAVDYVAFSSAGASVPEGFERDVLKKEVVQATTALGLSESNLTIHDYEVRRFPESRQLILEDLINLRRKNYDLVLLPSLNDMHQDHCVIAMEGVRAFKGSTILAYELLWNTLNSSSACFVRVDKVDVEAKVKALSCYKSQAGRSYMSAEFTYALAKTRGVQIGCEYAESFEVIRWVI